MAENPRIPYQSGFSTSTAPRVPYQTGFQASPVSTAYYSMGNMANSNAAAVAARVRAEGSLYTRTLATADAVAFSNLIASELDALRNQKRTDGFGNNANYLQALLRSAGGSKGNSALGAFDLDDTKALREAIVAARLNGVEYFTWLEDLNKSGLGSGGPKTKFSKDASTAINLIDKTDATTAYSKGYYTAFGKMPTNAQITSFMNKFNAQAKKEAVTTRSSGTTTTSTAGSTGKSTITRSGLGFTEEEQANYLAKYLSRDYAMTPELGGAAKTIYDEIRNTYKDNGLSEPGFEKIVGVITSIIGTGDAAMAKQKIETEKQKIRAISAKLNPGVADLLNSGEDMKTLADQYIKLAQSVTKKKYTMDSPVIKQMLNMKDDKGVIRAATDWEALGIIRGSNDWLDSSAAYSTFSNIGDVLTSKLGL